MMSSGKLEWMSVTHANIKGVILAVYVDVVYQQKQDGDLKIALLINGLN